MAVRFFVISSEAIILEYPLTPSIKAVTTENKTPSVLKLKYFIINNSNITFKVFVHNQKYKKNCKVILEKKLDTVLFDKKEYHFYLK